jgi:hypothetical protein
LGARDLKKHGETLLLNLLLTFSLTYLDMNDVIELILRNQASSNITHALAALGEGSVPDLKLLGKPDRSSAPPDPVSYDTLLDAIIQYFERQGNYNIPFDNNFDLSYHRSIMLKGKVYRSLFFNPAGTNVNLGQSTVSYPWARSTHSTVT